jgi:hypothetical protein|nr:MAG TPA: Poly(beta-D-mannuronate) C5 epimerase 4 [Caudoviricetes sp.]
MSNPDYRSYKIYNSSKYGKYVNVNDFGADPTGKLDSLAAIKSALNVAHKESAMVHFDGKYYISNQIVLDNSNSNVKGLFGTGMGKTTISFDKAQTGEFNPNTNHDDIRSDAGILVDHQNNKTIADLSIKYTNSDFYRKGLSYFGKVNGILVNDSDNTLISKVEVSGANRAGVLFTSTDALTKEENNKYTYKDRVIKGEIDENYETLPLGENNRVVDSYMHHNRVAGVMLGYQKNFLGENNHLAWNGHENDGGTGYGMAAMAGSYNYGVTYRGNTTDHNYRKGLDIHDGNNITIENNTLNGDRLYGIAAYNRQFSMSNVKIANNHIIQDPEFRLYNDDDLGKHYHMYSGIQVQTNTQLKDLHTADKGYFDISNNKIDNLTLYENNIQTYGIEFRNHEPNMDYVLNITNNEITGDSTKYIAAIINDTYDYVHKHNGVGTGTINISDNKATIGTMAAGAVPFYIEEKHINGDTEPHGTVVMNNNDISVTNESNGYREIAAINSNAKEFNITNNHFDWHGKMDKPLFEINSNHKSATLNVINNDIDFEGAGLSKDWFKTGNINDIYSANNTGNDKLLHGSQNLDEQGTKALKHVDSLLSDISDSITYDSEQPVYPVFNDETIHDYDLNYASSGIM